ncbi:MAG: lipid-A-disaccharide synthase [Pseudomonadota bacterium]
MARTIFFIVGEPSGDTLGASLMRAMKEKERGLKFVGVGGPLMEAEGLSSIRPMEELCVMGLFEVLGELPRLLRLIKTVASEVEDYKPDALVTIDLPDFNFEVVKRLRKKKFNTKFIHYIAPSVWAWRSGRAKMVANIFDMLLCAFPFEPQFFTKHGLETHYIGHSMVERVQDIQPQVQRDILGFDAEDKVLGLFFGSRKNEFKAMGKTIIDTAKQLQSDLPDVRFLVPTLPRNESYIKELLNTHKLKAIVSSEVEKKSSIFAACDAAIAVSGTVALELAYLKVPHILTYKAHPVTAFIVRRLIQVDHIHLANLIMDETIIPEYIQDNSRAEKLRRAILPLLLDQKSIQAQKEKLEALGRKLGEGDEASPSEKAADLILETI